VAEPVPSPLEAPEREPLVSVVVPVRDGGSALTELVRALEAQTLGRDRFEVIVADDGSTDGATHGLATADGWLRVVGGPPRNSYAARNRGVRAARAGAIAFCDADCRPDPEWLERGVAALEEADLVAGMVRFQTSGRLSVWALLDMDTHLDQRLMVRKNGATTANLLVRRETFTGAGGFDETLPSGGDADLARRCVAGGARLALAPEAVVLHPARASARSYLKKVWRVHTALAERAERARLSGRTPQRPGYELSTGSARARGWFTHIPFVTPVRGRRDSGQPVWLNRERLLESGVSPSRRLELAALAIRYGLVFYVELAARRRGHGAARRSAG
jgi:glycosyltransferase involved in cell wall biosynthesis